MRSQRAGPPMPGGRGGVGIPLRESLNAASSFAPSSALIFPSSIIFNIFILSSTVVMATSFKMTSCTLTFFLRFGRQAEF
jgi:hypothetical protein